MYKRRTFRLLNRTIDEIDFLAKKKGVSPSQVIAIAIAVAFDRWTMDQAQEGEIDNDN